MGLQVVSGPTWRIGLLALRADRGLTSRKTVRQAVALALDPGLLRPALGQWAVPHAAWLPPGAWAVRDAGPLLFDAARARRLLAQVAPIDPTMTLLASDQVSGPEAAAIADAIRVSLGAPGFRVRVRLEPPDAAEAAARQGNAELTLHEETLDVNDPDLFLRRLLGTDGATPGTATNVAFFRSPLVDGMLSRAGQLGFRPERLRIYQRLQALLAEELPYVPLYVRRPVDGGAARGAGHPAGPGRAASPRADGARAARRAAAAAGAAQPPLGAAAHEPLRAAAR